MNRRTLLAASVAVAVVSLVCLSSCHTAPKKSEGPEKPAKPSAAAARYMKTVEDRLGPIWYRLANIHEDDVQLGTVKTTFEIPAAGGKVRNVRVVSNTGGRMAELIARRAIDQLRAPPIPPEVLLEIHEDHVKAEEWFTVFANP